MSSTTVAGSADKVEVAANYDTKEAVQNSRVSNPNFCWKGNPNPVYNNSNGFTGVIQYEGEGEGPAGGFKKNN